jgi:hypothetical protein
MIVTFWPLAISFRAALRPAIPAPIISVLLVDSINAIFNLQKVKYQAEGSSSSSAWHFAVGGIGRNC